MIFSNEAALAEAAVDATPIIGGYSSLYGAALPLVENAQNEYNIFKAMLSADYSEMKLCESVEDNTILEAEITSLKEVSMDGIKEKLSRLFEMVASKVKEIYESFVSAFFKLTQKDKKYMAKLIEKANKNSKKNDVVIKWPKATENVGKDLEVITDVGALLSSNAIKQEKYSKKEWKLRFIGNLEESKVGDIAGGYDAIVAAYHAIDYKKVEKEYKEIVKQMHNLAKKVKVDKKDIGQEAYKNAIAYTNNVITRYSAKIEAERDWYKVCKSAFIKIAANPKNEAAMLFTQAICEEAEQEVDDAIEAQLPKEDISDVSTATKNVLDPGISDSADVSALHAPDNTEDYKPTDPKETPREESATDADILSELIY